MNTKKLVLQYSSSESQRLDHFLVAQLPQYSRSYLQSLIKQGYIKVGGIPIVKSGFRLEHNMAIEVELPPPQPTDLIPEKIPLDIVYEDDDLIIVNKPAGMVTHPSAGHHRGTLIHAVLSHCPDIEGVGGVQRPGLVHRLDKDTSGLIILAKNDATHRYLQNLFKKRHVDKTYIALVDSKPPTPLGRIEAAIGRDSKNRQRMAIVPEQKGRMAISEYKTLEEYAEHSLLQVSILTGRTHQIRLHLAFLNCPVVGDTVYGRTRPTLPVTRQMLHAQQLSFILPGGKKPNTFTADLPPDFSSTLELIRKQGAK